MSGLQFILPEGTELLAKDETALWQGRPATAGLARHVFRLRAVTGYFLVLAFWNIVSTYADGGRPLDAAIAAGWALLPAAACVAVIYAISFMLAATSHYMITDKRIIMQVGVALPIAVTLPLSKIGAADMKLYPGGSGDISVSFNTDDQIAYLLLWPHARPMRFKRAEPMLRAIANARDVSAILAKALAASSGQPSFATAPPEIEQGDGIRTRAGHGMAVA